MLIGKYRILKLIGNGAFSVVKLGFDMFTNQPVAVKIIQKSVISDQLPVEHIMKVNEILKMLDHPGIAKFIDFLEDENAYYVITEYCEGGELFDFIISRNRVEEPLAKKLFKQIVLTVDYMHKKGIVHRDLKPENILLTETKSIKIIDFGLANDHAEQPLHDRCGSPCYIAPESLTETEYYGIPADVWSLGVILYTLVDGSLPWNYQDSNRMYQQITTGDFPMPTTISVQCQDLLKNILNPDPTKRFSTEQILMHAWLFGVGNVFPLPRVDDRMRNERLGLTSGGFSTGDVASQRLSLQAAVLQKPVVPPTSSLATIYENPLDGPVQLGFNFPPMQVQKPTKKVTPRSVSLNSAAMSMPVDDGTAVHRGIIMSQTISHRDPLAVATNFENILIGNGIQHKRVDDLIFNISTPEVELTAEVCRLYGFRNVYVISFNRVQGDGWNYAQFVQSLLSQIKT